MFAQYIGGLGDVEDDIVACFEWREAFPARGSRAFYEAVAEDSGQSVLSSLDTQILPPVDGLTDCLSRGIRALDLGCGRGLVLRRLATVYPRAASLASTDAIAFARAHVKDVPHLALTVRFIVRERGLRTVTDAVARAAFVRVGRGLD